VTADIPPRAVPLTRLASYAVAVLATVLVALTRSALDPWLQGSAVLLPFTLAVLTAAVTGGIGPGLVATALSAVIGAFAFMEPRWRMAVPGFVGALHLTLFVGVSVVICFLSQRLERVTARASRFRQANARTRERYERDLRESREQLRAIADTMPQFVWSARADGYFDYYNERWYEYTGMPHTPDQGKSWPAHIHPDDRDRAEETWRRSLETGEPLDLEYRVRRGTDGSYRWFMARALPIRNERHDVTRWFGTCTDIDERRRLDEEREKLLGAERAARASVESSMRQREEFVGMLAHELRTPLNAILGWTQLLRRPAERDVVVRGLEVIERNTRAQAQIISDLLDMGRITSGRMRLTSEAVDLCGVSRAAVAMVRPAAEAKGLRLDAAMHGDTIVRGDPARLQQVVWNLLGNAVKFTPPGGAVDVLVERQADTVELRVSDSGEGIDPDFVPYMFDAYSQADSGATRTHGGLGLGLSITKHIVELHGGAIRAYSDGLGHGATFVVRLTSADAQQNAGVTEEQHVRLHGAHVLVVDDQPEERSLIARILIEGAAHVMTAASAAEAMEILARHRCDLVITDIGMPEVDGFELLKQMRGSDGGRRVPAVALTPFVRAEDRTRSLSAGFQGHVAKPIDPAELLAAVSSLLMLAERRSGAAGDPAPRNPLDVHPEIYAGPENLRQTERSSGGSRAKSG
jgi:PAS domain S-box-containing protein